MISGPDINLLTPAKSGIARNVCNQQCNSAFAVKSKSIIQLAGETESSSRVAVCDCAKGYRQKIAHGHDSLPLLALVTGLYKRSRRFDMNKLKARVWEISLKPEAGLDEDPRIIGREPRR